MKRITILKHNLMRATMTLAIMMACATAWAETVETYYIDENGARHDTTAIVLTDSPNTVYNLAPGWYVVGSSVINCAGLSSGQLSGTINIILADNTTLIIGSSGISLSSNNPLVIYSQSSHNGWLEIDSNTSAISALGGLTINGIVHTNGINAGDQAITLNGGTVFAYDGITTNGIITLNGGSVWSGSYSGTVTIAEGKYYKEDLNDNCYSGTLNPEQISAIVERDQELMPVTQTTYIQCCFGSDNDGSPEDPYIISNAEGWNALCVALQDNDKWHRFAGKTVKLGANIGTAQYPITRMAGGSNHDFIGTFDGDGHTLTIGYGTAESPIDAQYVAPFPNTTNDNDYHPTFRNLNISGHIYEHYTGNQDHHHVGGLIGHLYGTVTIEHCTSSVDITSTGGAGGFVGLCEHTISFNDCVSSAVIHSAGSSNGGFIGWSRSSNYTISFAGCVFNGKLLKVNGNGKENGGFIGWKGDSKNVTITNCLVDPAPLGEGETMANSNSATFSREHANHAATITNSYYTTAFGTAQGKQAYSITAGNGVTLSFYGSSTTYNVSNITTYTLGGSIRNPGMKYGNTYYSDANNQVSLNLETQTGYDFIGYTATAGTLTGSGNPYTLTMPNGNVTINGFNCNIPTGVTVSLTDNVATVSWTSYATAWQICLNDGEDHIYQTNATTYQISNLDPIITYTVKVRTLCNGGDFTNWTDPVTFHTDCVPYSLNSHPKYRQNFETPVVTTVFNSLTGLEVPACWENPYTTAQRFPYTKPHLIKAGAFYNYGIGQALIFAGFGKNYVTLPEFSNLNTLQISFKWATETYYSGTLTLGYITEEDVNYNTFTAISGASYSACNDSFGKLIEADPVELSNLPSNAKRLAFRWETDNRYQHGCSVDDVVVELIPSCKKPSRLNCTDYTATTATFAWTANGDNQTAWQLYISETNEAPADDIAQNLVINADANPFTVSGLQAETTYYAWVRGNCGDNDYSDWCSSYCTFTTPESCLTPTGFAVVPNSITNHNASLTWEGTCNSYQVKYRPADLPFAEWDTVTLQAAPVTLTGLSAETRYEATLQGICDEAGMSKVVGPITFTTSEACPAPSDLAYFNRKSSSVVLSWTNGGAANWVVAYKKTTDEDFTEVNVGTNDVTIVGTTVTYRLTGLVPETSYIVKVRDNCNGDGLSEWTSMVEFTTLSTCTVEEVTISNITHHAATVNWTGESASGYTVRYRTAAQADGLTAGFNSTIETDEWTKYSGLLADVMNGTITPTQYELGWNYNNTLVFGDNHATLNIYGFGCRYWLVSPFVNNLSNGSKLEFDLALTAYNSGDTIQVPNGQADDRFVVLIQSGDSLHILREWNNTGSEYIYNKIPNTGQHVSIDIPAPYYGDTVKIVFYGESTVFVENEDNDLHIDNVIVGVHMPAGEWYPVTATSEASAADISGLDPSRKYEVVVSPNCNENLHSDMISFSTVSANRKWFITAGNWGNPDNWEPTGVPDFEQNVVLKANATIESGCVAQAKNIIGTGTNEGSYTLTIEDGGKLKHFNSGVLATVKKHIAGYNENFAGWYFITNPLVSFVYPTEVENMIADPAENYDLYNWDYSYANEWQNYKNPEGVFYESILYNGMYGYLYANAEDTDLSFTGIIRQFNFNEYASCDYPDYPENYDLPGWYLLGNPFVCDAYLISGDGYPLPYYRMNATHTGIEAVAAGTPIAPMEGYFFHASNEEGGWTGLLYVITTEPAQPRTGNLNMTVSQGRSTKDNAILHFGEGFKLEKFSFGESSSKIYFPQGGKDYAIVTSDGVGEMPLNFTATENGQYTIMVNPENVEMGYLHLIDNMNGADVDLLEMPSYTFTATTTDYESRFKLVFVANGEDGPSTGSGTFAFIDAAGNIVVDGEGTLQVIDVMGRVVLSGDAINRVSTGGMMPGVYMLRLINGEDVRTQKIVIR